MPAQPKLTPLPPLPDRFLRPSEVAYLLDVPLETVYQWRKKRTGPVGFRVGRHVRYHPQAVQDWYAQQIAAEHSRAA
ncbi:helix-turn-helix transcriptional regulator [Streptomyces sp. NPDC002209]|uniref:helix-turn-helix transcriptional regulator n=1 Tax=Streptomyces sp. NPDC002209 TaxID=3364638 RepID=UPI0036830927